MISYEGLFFEKEEEKIIFSKEGRHLRKVNDHLHCTFKYHPQGEEIFNDIVGKYFDIYLIGYGNDGKNSAFEIDIKEDLKRYYINYDEEEPSKLKIPHITVSLSGEGKPNDSKDLTFKKIDKPIKLRGRFGYFIKDNGREYISFEKF